MTITRARIRRILVTIFILLIFVSVLFSVLGLVIPNNFTAALVAFIATLVAIITLPPFDEYIEDIFEPRETGADAVRTRLKKYWVEQFLYKEQETISRHAGQHTDQVTQYILRMNDDKPQSLELQDPDLDFPFQIPIKIDDRYPPAGAQRLYPTYNQQFSTKTYRQDNKVESVYRHVLYAMQYPANKATRSNPNERGRWRDFIVIQGERGSGRTTKLLELADYFLTKRSTARVPIYLNLFSWQSNSQAFDKWLVEELVRQYELPAWEAKSLLRTNYLILLLDDFEDVLSHNRRHLMEAIEDFLERRNAPVFGGEKDEAGTAAYERAGTLRDAVIIATEKVDQHADAESLSAPKVLDSVQGDFNYPRHFELIRQHELRRDNLELVERFHPACIIDIQPLHMNDVQSQIRNAESRLSQQTRRRILDSPLLFYRNRQQELIEVLSQPFYLFALMYPYRSIETVEEDNQSNNWVFRNLFRSNDTSPLPTNQHQWQKRILEDYAQDMVWRLPNEPGPIPRDPFIDPEKEGYVKPDAINREQVMEWLARTMHRQNRTVIRRQDALFYLEDRLYRPVRPMPGADREQGPAALPPRYVNEFRGLSGTATALTFLGLFTLFYFTFPQDGMRPSVAVVCALLFGLFGRNFGYYSCMPPHFTLSYDTYVGWNWRPGLIAAVLMSLIVGLIFFDVSCALYLERDGTCLTYEATIYGIFTFMLFLLIGGLEIGRRYEIVTRPNELVRYLMILLFMSLAIWVLFFFLFIIWPRTLIETAADIRTLLIEALIYSTFTGVFLSLISTITLVHSIVRHWLMLWFLGVKINYRVRFTNYLEQFVSIGLMRKVDGGYVFRHRRLLEYFSDDDFNPAKLRKPYQ